MNGMHVRNRLILRNLSLSSCFSLRPRKCSTLPVITNDQPSTETLDCLKYIDASPDPFHCIKYSSDLLEKNGFKCLDESSKWNCLEPGGKYFYTKGMSSMVAFAVGKRYVPGNGFKIIGAHTDSPNLRVKPNVERRKNGVVQVNVACYGGGLWHTWFDRDLSVSGLVIVRQPNGTLSQRLAKIDRRLLRISNLCIHLTAAEDRDAFRVNKEDHLMPILCTEAQSQLNSVSSGTHSVLIEILAESLNCNPDDVAGFDLSLYDTQAGTVVGANSEFLVASRLDNLVSCHTSLSALVSHCTSSALTHDDGVSMVALFDHEEVGSGSATGAGSVLMRDALERVHGELCDHSQHELLHISRSRSFIISADMAHAIHPNYSSKHDLHHAPVMNGGVVIKDNANQRYATTGVTRLLASEIAKLADVPTQSFMVRNDCPCGSTIGPIISANTGIRAVDLGMAQLSMHSIREVMGCNDLKHGLNYFTTFFNRFSDIDKSLH